MKCKICKKRIWPFWARYNLADDLVWFDFEYVVTTYGDVIIDDLPGRVHYNCWASCIHTEPRSGSSIETQGMKERRDPPCSFIKKSPRKIPARPKDYEDFIPSYEKFTTDNPDCMSGLVTLPQFSKIVDLFKWPSNDVVLKELQAVLSGKEIRTYTGLGYIEQTYNNRYILTRKGQMAFYQNLVFRGEVEEAKKEIEKELMLDTPPPKVNARLMEEIGVIEKEDDKKLIAVSGKNVDIIELTYLADALMENGVDPMALLKEKLAQAKNLKRYHV